jgi:Tol biopolymer transport system component
MWRVAEMSILDLASGRITKIHDSLPQPGTPTWSPDGRRIAFVSDRSNRVDHENEIWVVGVDGDGLERLTTNDVWDLEPAWR